MSSPLRHFRRLDAPASLRKAGPQALAAVPPDPPLPWGIRVHADEDHRVNERLELLVTVREGAPVVVVAEVAWILALPPGAPGRYEAGLRIVSLPADAGRLEAVLGA